jgi:hypothetical protein
MSLKFILTPFYKDLHSNFCLQKIEATSSSSSGLEVFGQINTCNRATKQHRKLAKATVSTNLPQTFASLQSNTPTMQKSDFAFMTISCVMPYTSGLNLPLMSTVEVKAGNVAK